MRVRVRKIYKYRERRMPMLGMWNPVFIFRVARVNYCCVSVTSCSSRAATHNQDLVSFSLFFSCSRPSPPAHSLGRGGLSRRLHLSITPAYGVTCGVTRQGRGGADAQCPAGPEAVDPRAGAQDRGRQQLRRQRTARRRQGDRRAHHAGGQQPRCVCVCVCVFVCVCVCVLSYLASLCVCCLLASTALNGR